MWYNGCIIHMGFNAVQRSVRYPVQLSRYVQRYVQRIKCNVHAIRKVPKPLQISCYVQLVEMQIQRVPFYVPEVVNAFRLPFHHALRNEVNFMTS